MISQTLIDLSREEQIKSLDSGYEKHISVILSVAALSNLLTTLKFCLLLTTESVKSAEERAIKSLLLLKTKFSIGDSYSMVLKRSRL